MKISGLTVARNAVKFDYPLIESIRSALDVCDEYIVNIGEDDEDTFQLLKRSLNSSKLKILRPSWDDSVREKGLIFSRQTNHGLDQCTGDWILYLQADEVVHERDLPLLKEILARELANPNIEGFEMPFVHFYGRYDVIQDHPRKWHTKTIRIVRRKLLAGLAAPGAPEPLFRPEIRSWDDAAGFRVVGGPRELMLKTILMPVTVYHYGWCRHPKYMYEKQRFLERYYHSDEWVAREYREVSPDTIYNDLGHLAFFKGTHPRVMEAKVAGQSWRWDPHIERQFPDGLRHFYLKWFYKWEVKWGSLKRAVTRFFSRSGF